MSSISQILKHDVVLAEVLANLRQGKTPRILLQGASGTGKSYLAAQAQTAWESNRDAVIYLRGDIGRTQEPYYPLTGLFRTRTWRTETRRLFEAAAEDSPVAKSLLKRTVELFPSDTSSQLVRQLSLPQDPTAVEAFTILRTRTQHSDTLLVLDDVHLYDAKTLTFLTSVIQNPQVLGKGAQRLRVLALENTDEPNGSTLYLAFKAVFRKLPLQYCQQGEFRDLLAAAGWRWELPDDLSDRLYSYSHGHLRVVHELVSHFQDRPHDTIEVEDADLIKMVLHLRLADRHAEGETVRDVFTRAAVIGSSFLKSELECLIASDKPVADALKTASEMQIVHDDGMMIRFQHGSIHKFFLELAEQQHRQFHVHYAECLREMRPSDYPARAYHLRLATSYFQAAIAAIQNQLSSFRCGSLVLDLDDVGHALFGLDVYMQTMHEAYAHLCRGEYTAAYTAASAIHDAYPEILIAERDYLVAEALLHEIGNEAAAKALDLLIGSVHAAEPEGELYCRILYLTHMAQAQLGEYAKSRATQKLLMRYLAERRFTDPGLNRLLTRVQLASDSVEHIETAGLRIQTALVQMERQRQLNGVVNPLDLYVAHTNFAANRILAGVYDQADIAAIEALRLVSEHSPVVEFPTPWCAWNNYFLSAYLGGTSSLEETTQGFQQMLDRIPHAGEDMLIRINMANCLARAGDFDGALQILDRHSQEFFELVDCDEYYVYYSEHCRSAVLFLMGRSAEALDLWEAIGNLLSTLQPGVRDYLQHRHAELHKFMLATQTATPDEWDAALSGSADFRGGPWRFFKRGFLFTDIQVWYRF